MRNWTDEQIIRYCQRKGWRGELMGKEEYKRFDSLDRYEIHSARLTKDAESRDGDHGKMVRVTFVSTCRSERYENLWVEANVQDFQCGVAEYLKRGDVLGVRGKPGMRRYGDDNERVSFELIRAELMIPPSLFSELKERGWEPGAGSEKPAKKGGKVPPKGKKAPPAKAKRTVIDVDDEDDGDEDGED